MVDNDRDSHIHVGLDVKTPDSGDNTLDLSKLQGTIPTQRHGST